MSKIVLKPYGGLSNRILAINATVNLSKYLGLGKPIVIWERNQDLNAKFSDLFKSNENFVVKEVNCFNWFRPMSYFQLYNIFHPSHYRYPFFNRLLGRERSFDLIFYDHPINDSKVPIESLKINSQKGMVYIASHYEYFVEERFVLLQPLDGIERRVRGILKNFKPNTFGFHVRRTDNRQSITMSPDDVFIKKANELLINKENYLFMASDCLKTKIRFQQLFGNRIIVNDNKGLSRDSLCGMENAVVDFYCLAKTCKIYGSYGSTFGYTASKTNKRPFEELIMKS